MYAIFPHTADLGIRAAGATLEELMGEAARGLFEVIAGNLDQIRSRPERAEHFHVPGSEPTWLLFDWMRELHAAFELRRMLFRDFDVRIDAAGLHATASGEPYDPARHLLAHEVKAVTQHALSVRRTAEGWHAEVIVDI